MKGVFGAKFTAPLCGLGGLLLTLLGIIPSIFKNKEGNDSAFIRSAVTSCK